MSEVPKQPYPRQEYSNKSLSSVYKNLLHFPTLIINQQKENKAISFTSASKKIKYLEINVTEEVKALFKKKS